MVQAIDMALDSNVHIINMSLGADIEDQLLSRMINAGVKKGVLFVAPVGNQPDAQKICFPASHPKVVAVAGKNEDGTMFPSVAIAAKANVYGPCQNVFSTMPENNHNFLTGTSLSSAIVSGILALSREKGKTIGIEDLPDVDGDLDKWTEDLLK